MRENRRTRMILILNSEMTRQELFGELVETLVAHFGINSIENLESTNASAEYNVMIHDIEERIQNSIGEEAIGDFKESYLSTFTSPTISP